MDSEFTHVPLDHVRYSLVWEDNLTLARALEITPADVVLVVTSAGCNALNALLLEPRRVVAVDLNDNQNALLRFKQHLIQHHAYEVLHGILGLAGAAAVAAAWATIAPGLPPHWQAYWSRFFALHPAGLLPSGRLEAYATAFLTTLPADLQLQVRHLLDCASVADQQDHFRQHLHVTAFRSLFIQYFDAASLSQGRDTRLFRYAPETGGQAFYNRLVAMLARHLLRDNFYARFLLFGPVGLPEAILPPCYQAHHYAHLRAQLPRLAIHTGEVIEYLLSAAGADVTKASLSNIFEYVSPTHFRLVTRALAARAGRPLRFVYWNLLQDQHPEPETILAPLSAALTAAERCFYFRNVRAYTTLPVSELIPL